MWAFPGMQLSEPGSCFILTWNVTH